MSNQQTKKKAADDIAQLSFEQGLEKLENVVRQLEGGNKPLDEAISAYEYGTMLRKHCEAKLSEAKMRVEKIVTDQDGNISTEMMDGAP